MGIRIEMFEESILISVTDEISEQGVGALVTTLEKHMNSPKSWVYVDFTKATLTPTAKASIASLKQAKLKKPTRESANNPQPSAESQRGGERKWLSKTILIGSDPRTFEVDSMTEALEQYKSKDGSFLLEKIKLQNTFDRLTREKKILVESLGGAAEASQDKLSLFKLNHALRQLRKRLSTEVKTHTASLARLKKRRSGDPRDIDAVNSQKDSLIAKLQDLGIIPKT
jgi:hypothetical protein